MIEITITVPKGKWLKALADGWKERFNEDLPIQDIEGVGAESDFPWAVPHIDFEEDEIEVVEYK